MLMKRKVVLSVIAAISALGLWSCTQESDGVTDTSQVTLNESITTNAESLGTALDEISSSDTYNIMTLEDSITLKSASMSAEDDPMYSSVVSLADISGIYEYQPAVVDTMYMGDICTMYNHFNRTGDSDAFVIKLPGELVMHPGALFFSSEGTDSLKNDFVITTTNYSYRYDAPSYLSYRLETGIDLADQHVGDLKIEWEMGVNDVPYDYYSQFALSSGYTVSVQVTRGDSAVCQYTLAKGDQTLYSEKVQWIRDIENATISKEHSITIGDIQIVGSSKSDTIKIYKGGELQKNTTVTVVGEGVGSENGAEWSTFCGNYRDYKITLDDGTALLLSDVMGNRRNILGKLFASMHEMRFATHLVNYIAWNVAYRQQSTSSGVQNN